MRRQRGEKWEKQKVGEGHEGSIGRKSDRNDPQK